MGTRISGQPLPEPSAWDAEADVIVLGSGGAGLFAAIEAAEMGASVIVLESEPQLGGSTQLSGGYVTLCETPLVPNRREELLADLDEAHHHDAYFELSRIYVEQAGDTYARLTELGVEFAGTMQFAHMSHPWAHEPGGIGGGAEIITKLERAALRRGVAIHISTRATAMIRDGRNRITGVAAQSSKGIQSFHARRAVVVATGGFTRNLDLVRAHGRAGADGILPVTGPGSRGDGLLMGLGVDAATSYLQVGVAPTVPVDPGSRDSSSLVNYMGAILVNRDGKRFCRESESYTELSWAGLQQPDQMMIQIYDSAMRRTYMGWQLAKILGMCEEITAPTIEDLAQELAGHAGVDAAALMETVWAYNGNADAGHDPDFGRKHLLGTTGALLRIEQAPFHAVVLRPGTTHFNGGLRVNRNMQVLTVDGDIIPGLYAVGEVTGGFHGAGYMSGSFLGSALIFGRIAGRNAADERRPWGDTER